MGGHREGWAAAAALAATAWGVMGCGVAEGDYRVYRVSVERTIVADACYVESMSPEVIRAQQEEQQSSASLLTPVTYVIYYGAGDHLVLDAAGVSIRGEETSDGFEFVADTIDVEYAGVDQSEAKITVTTHTTVTMEVDGSAVKGERLDAVTTTCDFLTATPSGGLCDQVTDCTRRTPFFGVELEDVDVSTVINRPNPG
jgi:hypothetical protein